MVKPNMIVKVQVPVAAKPVTGTQCLIYNRSESYCIESHLLEQDAAMMGGSQKVYFHARFTIRGKSKSLRLIKPCANQNPGW